MNHIAVEEMGRRPLTSDELQQLRLMRADDPEDFLGIEYGGRPVYVPKHGLRGTAQAHLWMSRGF